MGVTGCRIIDSKRERLIAMLTNSFIPCNGRFPIIISMVSIFLVSADVNGGGILSALVLLSLIIVSIFTTFAVSRLLSRTLLRGEASTFTLELPPYRMPKFWQTVARSVLDRTLFVLGRAVAVAAPAGLVIWILANLRLGDVTLLASLSQWLEPIGRFFGMDGVILLGFLLALPACEIAIPIMLMIYTGGGVLTEYASLGALGELLSGAGWNVSVALCVALFSIFHFPCSTTLLTIKKETGRWRWAALSALISTAVGFSYCLCVRFLSFLVSAVL